MPIYEYKCNKCEKEIEKISVRYEPVQEYSCCEKDCGGKLKLQISMPADTDSTLGYPKVYNNITSEPVLVEGRAHKRELLKKHGLADIGPTIRFGY